MYGYEEYFDLVPEQILQKVTQEQIFEFVLEQPFNTSLRYISPCRADKKPGCRFETRTDGTILFVDFGERLLTGRTHRTCFRLVMDKFKCNLAASIKILCQHFNLSSDSSDYKPVIVKQYERTVTDKDFSKILWVAKNPAKWDIIYWSQFLIKPEHLKEDSVFTVSRYTIYNNKGVFTFSPYKYCYAIDFISKVKLYQPYGNDENKWITNCDEDCIGNIDNLPPTGDELIIQKSYKDHRVVRNTIEGSNVIYFQNEGCVPSLDILKNLTDRFRQITIFFDADEDGILAAIKLQAVFNQFRENCCRIIHLPVFVNRKLTHKDPAEFIHKEGRLDLIEAFKQIKLWNNYPQ